MVNLIKILKDTFVIGFITYKYSNYSYITRQITYDKSYNINTILHNRLNLFCHHHWLYYTLYDY